MRQSYDNRDFQIEIISEKKREIIPAGEYQLFYVIQGQIAVGRDGNMQTAAEQEVFLKKDSSQLQIHSEKEAVYAVLHFQGEVLYRYFSGKQIDFMDWEQTDFSELSAPLQKLREELEKLLNITITKSEKQVSLQQVAQFYQVLDALCIGFAEIGDSDESGKQSQDRKLVSEYVEQHYAEPLTLQQVADAVYLSYYALSRSFRDLFGMKFYDYLGQVRLRHVVFDLIHTDKTMTQIAMDNGFGSLPAFSRSFKAFYGMSPRDYQKQERLHLQEQKKQEAMEPFVTVAEEPISKPELPTKMLRADKKGPAELLEENPFSRMINGGHVMDLRDGRLLRTFREMHDEIGFSYVRFWNPFHECMDIRVGHGTDQLNFQNLDRILDELVDAGIKPWIDFGDKPKIIADRDGKEDSEIQRMIGRSIYRSKAELEKLMEAFLVHVIRRYGKKEVSQWVFEFWNDEQQAENAEKEAGQRFFEVMDSMLEMIKSYLPAASVGGGGMSSSYLEEQFIKGWSEHRRPDFISLLYFPYDTSDNSVEHMEGLGYVARPEFFAESLQNVHRMLQKYQMVCRVYVVEFTSSISSRNYGNDSCYQAAYCMRNALESLDMMETLGFFCASDLPFIGTDTKDILFGGNGMVSKDQLCKPVYYTFDFLHQLDTMLLYHGADGAITTDGGNHYTIVSHNFESMDLTYYNKTGVQGDIEKHLRSKQEKQLLCVNLDRVENGVYRCAIWKMGPEHGGLLEEWSKLGFGSNLGREEISYLKKQAVPKLELQTVEVTDQTLQIEMILDAQEIVMIKVERMDG